jgi:hypothetical protein
VTFGRNGDDPTARRRRAPDEVLLAAQEVIRRHGAGESARSIARGLGLSRTSVDRIVQQYRDAQRQREELDAEAATLVAKYEGGFNADFDIADADPELVARFEDLGIDLTDPDAVGVLAALTNSPTDALSNWRIGHLPKTAEWQAGHDMLGRQLLRLTR